MDALGRVVKHRPVLFDTPPVRATFFSLGFVGRALRLAGIRRLVQIRRSLTSVTLLRRSSAALGPVNFELCVISE